MKAERILPAGATLGEGPVWREDTGQLLWLDIDGKKLHFFSPETGGDAVLPLPEKPGSVCVAKSGALMLTLQDGVFRMEKNGRLTRFLDSPERDFPENRFNDGKCDPQGRFWAGTINMAGKMGRAALYCIEGNGRYRAVLREVSVSNGLAWSRDGKYFYYIDTPSGFLWRFDWDGETGSLKNRTALVDYREEPGRLDGMTIDRSGNLWTAQWGGFQVCCWDPLTGKKLEQISLPVPYVSSCTFGGKHLDSLFITTASGKKAAAKTEYPESGDLFVCSPGVRGWNADLFADI